MLLKKASRLVMIGDSVTDCGRGLPVGEGASGGLGNGYVSLVDGYLQVTYPQLQIRTINTGISGNTVRDLDVRWQKDVMDLQPDWLSIMIGINDVWRQFDSPHRKEVHVLLEEYRDTLERLVVRTRPVLEGLILMTPYIMEPNRQDPMRVTMDAYGRACHEIADRHDCLLVDTQAGFDRLFQYYHPYIAAGDRIHPNHIGATLLSRSFLQAIGA